MNLILGCADSLIAHTIYADFLEDEGKDTSFFRVLLQMRRFGSYVLEGSGYTDIKGDGFFINETCYWYGSVAGLFSNG